MQSNKISAMILAAGFGKRLENITQNVPKPLVKISGKTLIQSSLELLNYLNINDIIINIHYKHSMIRKFIKKNHKKNIKFSYEEQLFDTAGGVKKAFPLFKYRNVLVLNSDIFWKKNNYLDVKKLIINYKIEEKCKLLLVPKRLSHGIYKKKGDFFLNKKKIFRYKNKKNILYYSGAQIIDSNYLNNYKQKKFSFNIVWDDLIGENSISGEKMSSCWYHVGDLKGLKDVKNSIT